MILTEYTIKEFHNSYIKTETCWIWIGYLRSDNYGIMKVGKKRHRAHRVSYAIHYDDYNDELLVLHRCDNPSCVNSEHLFLGTKADNNADCKAKGRNNIGERHGLSILTEEQIKEIRFKAAMQIPYHEISKEYNTCISNISLILHGHRWKHIK